MFQSHLHNVILWYGIKLGMAIPTFILKYRGFARVTVKHPQPKLRIRVV